MSYYNAYPAGGYPYPPQPQYPPQAQYPPPAAPVSSYPGLPPTGPTPYSYPQPYGEACPSTGPFPMPPQQSAAYQPYQVAPGPPPYTNPAAHPVPAPTAGGIRKAFLVGINYIGNPNAHLDGCINDTNYLKYMLMSKFKFEPNNMLVLTDDQQDPLLQPTRANIINGFRWLINGAKPGDSLFFSFSGHGGQIPDLNGDEIDGLDETIMPVDYKINGPIVDDDIHALLAMGVPAGAKLTAVMDCCHSGTGMDLPFSYSTGCQSCDPLGTMKVTRGDVVCFSGCRDDQTSADSAALSHVAHSGVLTYSFVKSVEDHHPYLTYLKYSWLSYLANVARENSKCCMVFLDRILCVIFAQEPLLLNLNTTEQPPCSRERTLTIKRYASLLQTMQTACRQKGFRQIIQLTSGQALNMNNPFTL